MLYFVARFHHARRQGTARDPGPPREHSSSSSRARRSITCYPSNVLRTERSRGGVLSTTCWLTDGVRHPSTFLTLLDVVAIDERERLLFLYPVARAKSMGATSTHVCRAKRLVRRAGVA